MTQFYESDEQETEHQAQPTASQLAQLLLNWEQVQREADWLADQIIPVIMQQAATLTVGDARATYTKGRSAYLWEKSCLAHPDVEEREAAILNALTQPAPFTDWHHCAETLRIAKNELERGEATPSVRLKLL